MSIASSYPCSVWSGRYPAAPRWPITSGFFSCAAATADGPIVATTATAAASLTQLLRMAAPLSVADRASLTQWQKLEGDACVMHDGDAHRVLRRAAALGRRAGVEDREAVALLVQRHMGVAEDGRLGVREATPHAFQ